ncbi:hypothetical protein [Streptococcus sanguinis]|jgi:hypothetical protein|uniref:hypothetical protein n=1 Tax=Streptococcus sanguinis TaxID=1305 RepID=UPI0020703E18|nr:MAG TPA: head closure knob [Caudoviricetes sp.]
MRFDKRCTLVIKSEQKPRYDADLGKMVGGETTEKVVPANIGPVSAQLQNLLGDKLKDVTKVVRVRRIKGKISSLLIDGKPYNIVRTPEHTNGMTVFYVSEVKNGV